MRKQAITPAPPPPRHPVRPKQGDIVLVDLLEAGKHHALVVSPTDLIDLSS